MFVRSLFKNLTGFLAILCILVPSSSHAQSVCSGLPFLGTNGPELCVHIEETPAGASMDFRGPAGPGVPPISISETIGDYLVDINVVYVFDAGGMVVMLTGTVTRTSPGTGGISVVADGGWGTPLGAGGGDLRLNGFSTGTSLTQLGGAAGFPVGLIPEQDLAYTGFPAILDVPTNGPEIFIEDLFGQPRADGTVAIHLINTFNVNVVGESVTVPSDVGAGNWQPLVPRGDVVGRITHTQVDENGNYTVELEASNTDSLVSIISFIIETNPLPDSSDVSASGPGGPLECGEIFGDFGCTTGFDVPDGAEYMMMFTGTLLPEVDQQDGVVLIVKDFNQPPESELFFTLVRPPSTNSPPVILNSFENLDMVLSDSNTFNLNEFFSDPEGGPLTFSASSSDSSVVSAGVMDSTLTLFAAREGTASIAAFAEDPLGAIASDSFNVMVLPSSQNSSPVIVMPLFDLAIPVGDTSAVNLGEFFFDPDNDPLNFTANSSDSSVVSAAVTDSTLRLGAVREGTASIVVFAEDPLGAIASDTFNVIVQPSNTPPEVAVPFPNLTMQADRDVETLDLNTHFTDADGDNLTFTATSSDPAVAEATINDGILTIIALTKGTVTVTVIANDGRGGTAEAAVQVDVPTKTHADELGRVIPTEFDLYQNYPDPFNPTTTIRFDIPETSRINLFVYDMLGRQVASLVEGMVSAGKHIATFDARGLASGAYIYSLETPDGVFSKTMLLVK